MSSSHLSVCVRVRVRASWSYSSSSVSIATRQKDRRPPPPTTHIPLHSRLCNYECCRPASPTVLQALPGINSWCVKDITMTISNQSQQQDWDQVMGGGNKCITAERAQRVLDMEVSTFPIPVCLTRWSAELLIVVIETAFSWLVYVCLQMGS